MNTQRSLPLSREVVIHLNGLEGMTAGKRLFELRTQPGKFQEHFVESAIATVDPLIAVEHDEGIGNRVEDGLGAFALVDGLIDAGAEDSHIGKRKPPQPGHRLLCRGISA